MERFIKDGKFIIPEEEISNIYVWTKMSHTQEVLISSKTYYDLISSSFSKEANTVISILKNRLPSLDNNSYIFADYLTFSLNKSIIFNNRSCFAYMTNLYMLSSLCCYIAQNYNLFLPEEDSINNLIITKVENPEGLSKILESDFVIFRDYTSLHQHKYRDTILGSILSNRSKQGKFTLIYVQNKSILIGDGLISEERANDRRLKDLSKLVKSFNERRNKSSESLLSDWFSMMNINEGKLVYSKTKPDTQTRKIGRYL